MIVETKKQLQIDPRGRVIKAVISGLLCDWHDMPGNSSDSAITSLDGLCGEFPAGTRVRITIERLHG